MRSDTNRSCGCVVYQAKNHIKLRAMTEYEFCKTQHCETCPEFLHAKNNRFGSQCALNIKSKLTGKYGDPPYRDSNGKYILVSNND